MQQIDTADHQVADSDAVAAPAAGNTRFTLTPPHSAGSMTVTKRSGRREPVDLNKIVRAIQRAGDGLYAVDPMRVATRTISGLYDGATTQELDELSIRTATPSSTGCTDASAS